MREDLSGGGWLSGDAERSAGDPRGLLAREWVMPNGRGGYAMGNAAFVPTRRYHGLLVVAPNPPAERWMLLPRVEEVLRTEHGDVDLTSAFYLPGDGPIQGLDVILDFRRDPHPFWLLEGAGRILRRRIEPAAKGQGVRLSYELLEGGPATLLVRPLLTSRDHHAVAREGDYVPEWEHAHGKLSWQAHPDHPLLSIEHDGRALDDPPTWYRNGLLPTERTRGYDHVEDLHAPLRLAFELHGAGECAAWTATVPGAPEPPPAWTGLTEAAARFVIRHPGGEAGILAGYPWFTEWGRDTMIALPGLLLASGAHALAEEILSAWAERLRDGLLPNRLEERQGTEQTNSADAPLHFLRAIELWSTAQPASSDAGAARFWPAVRGVLDGYLGGDDHGIAVDGDGLLQAGVPGLALTWMDAVLPSGTAVTPRIGKAIELNALLLSGLRFGLRMAELRGEAALAQKWSQAAERLAAALGASAFDEAAGCLRDLLDEAPTGEAFAVRPNQLWALALEPSPFPAEQRERALDTVDAQLLTPRGLRTLQADHPRYEGRYGGDQPARDAAYHQGTVWPWLVGPWAEATLAVRGNSAATRSRIEAQLAELFHLLDQTRMVPEVCDGDAPHAPGGCPTQAWSVAALLWVRHLLR